MSEYKQLCQIGQLIELVHHAHQERVHELDNVKQVLDANTPREGCFAQRCEYVANCRELGNFAIELAEFRARQDRG